MIGLEHILQTRSLRSMLIMGLLLLNTALVYLVIQRQKTIILYLLVGVGLVLTFLRWPPVGLILTSLSGIILPLYGRGGINLTVILIALLLGLWLLDMVVRQHRIRLVPSRAVWPLLAFLAVALFAFGMGQLPWFTFAPHAPMNAQLGGLSILVLSIGIFLLVANQVQDLSWLKRMTWAFLAIAGLAVVIGSVLPKLGLPTQKLIQPVGSVYFIWVVALAFSQAAFNRDLHPGWRFILGCLLLYVLYSRFILGFANKSGWIPVAVCIAAIIGFRSRRAVLVLIPVIALVAIYFATRVISSEEYSVSTRFDAWVIIAQIIQISPIWGLGFANYYWYTPLFPIRGYAVRFNSHNNYVDIIAQTGLVGLACFLWFLWEVGRLGWRLRMNVPPGFAQAYVYGALGGLVGTAVTGMFGDWVLPFVYNIGLSGFRTSMLAWLFLGGLVSLEHIVMSPKLRTL